MPGARQRFGPDGSQDYWADCAKPGPAQPSTPSANPANRGAPPDPLPAPGGGRAANIAAVSVCGDSVMDQRTFIADPHDARSAADV